jgi:hypothetical protein
MPRAHVALAPLVVLSLLSCGSDQASPNPNPNPAPDHLAFTVKPGLTATGQPITPAVEVSAEDASSNLVDSFDKDITVSLASGPTGAVLGGTTTIRAVGGVAKFSDLQISPAGTSYALNAAASGLADAVTTPFEVATPGVAATIEAVGGGGQAQTVVGQPVSTSPSAKVSDRFGTGIAGIEVTFEIAGGGGSVTGANQTTDAGGIATVGEWLMGTTPGTNWLRAVAPGLQGSPAVFLANAVAGPAVTLTRVEGDGQTAQSGTMLTINPSVQVTDVYSNPVSGVPVTFQIVGGGGSITGASQLTGAQGIATLGSWTLGATVGMNTVTATSPGLTGSPITFTATATPFVAAIRVEVRNNYFISMQNGSGGNVGLFGSVAIDTVPVGGTVSWEWIGQVHNVTSLSSPTFPSTPSYSAPHTYGPVTFSARGRYNYRCTIHSSVSPYFGLIGMRGTIVVR